MKAAQVDGPGRLRIVERPDPEPARDEILVAPRAVGICGTDIEILDGTMAYYRSGQARYPVIPGHEWAGEVVAVGTAVRGMAPGDHVVGEVSLGCGRCELCAAGMYHVCADARETGIMGQDGALATRMTHPASAAFAIPREMGWGAGALIEPTSVALNSVRRGGCRGKRVLVVGMGTIGQLALQCAKAEGAASVIAANPSPGRLQLAADLGADATAQLRTDLESSLAAIRAATVEPIEVVLVCTGAAEAIDLAVAAVRPAGAVVLVGLTGASRVSVDIDTVVAKDVDLRGVNGSPGIWPETIALVASGRVRTEPLVSHRLPLAEAARAFELARGRGPGTLKVVVEPQA